MNKTKNKKMKQNKIIEGKKRKTRIDPTAGFPCGQLCGSALPPAVLI